MEVSGGISCFFFHITEEGWVRRGGKGERGYGEIFFGIVCQNIIPLSLDLQNNQSHTWSYLVQDIK